MAKRFIDTDLFKKSFFRGLSAPHKLLWIYILTDCNHAGIWEVDFEIAKMRCGCDDLNEVKKIFKDKIVEFDNGLKWFIPSFIEFQYCELSEHNKAHISVLKLLNQYKLMGYLSPLQGAKDKDKVQDKDMDKEKDKDKDRKKPFDPVEFFKAEYQKGGVLKGENIVDLYKSFIDMRKRKGKPIKTEYGVLGHISKLEKSKEPEKMLKHSTDSEYQGLFDPPENTKKTEGTGRIAEIL